ncbi:multidrug resistance protein 1 [Colletotrichum tofieldiae]|nr:multidrug resistance protein 1 [Colletotrichum tofieldiae]
MSFVMALASLLAYGVFGWVSNALAQHVLKSCRFELFGNISRQNVDLFDVPTRSTGALVSRLSTEPQSIMELLSMNIGMILVNKLGLVLTSGALSPLLAAGYARIRLEFKLEQDTTERFANSAGYATEATLTIRTVASLALETHIIDHFRDSLQDVAEKSIKALGWNMFWYSLSQSISYGGQLMVKGEYSSTRFYTAFMAVVFSGEAIDMQNLRFAYP